VRVEDKRHGVSVPIDRRSNGFVWFFSFLVSFSQIRKRYPNRPLVLLLDEPGTALHGLAQRDFLKVLEEPLADHQILYTTHQPFLVDPDRLDRARPVVDVDDAGTKVYEHAYRVDRDTLFPLEAALGYEIGQTLFVAPNVLLVEGTSDLIYLQLLSRACEAAGKDGLDRRWTITPVGGVDKMDTFVRLFKGQQLNICAVIDATDNKLTKVEKLVRDGDLQPGELIKVAGIVGADQADMEDVMSPDFYLKLVQGVGREDSIRAIYGIVSADRLPDVDTSSASPGASTRFSRASTRTASTTCHRRSTSNATATNSLVRLTRRRSSGRKSSSPPRTPSCACRRGEIALGRPHPGKPLSDRRAHLAQTLLDEQRCR
jgi:hypothetical protein